jgi:hypoxanthine phosphoribosyltransferase
MLMIVLKDRSFELLLNRVQIHEKVCELAAAIEKDYVAREPLFLVVLNGAFIFASDLLREMSMMTETAFIRLSSYHQVTSTGRVKESMPLSKSVKGRDVVIVEDIVDTGLTLRRLLEILRENEAASAEVVSLLSKARDTTHNPQLKYAGFEISDKFVVGYGLDYEGYGRNLKDIYQLV